MFCQSVLKDLIYSYITKKKRSKTSCLRGVGIAGDRFWVVTVFIPLEPEGLIVMPSKCWLHPVTSQCNACTETAMTEPVVSKRIDTSSSRWFILLWCVEPFLYSNAVSGRWASATVPALKWFQVSGVTNRNEMQSLSSVSVDHFRARVCRNTHEPEGGSCSP